MIISTQSGPLFISNPTANVTTASITYPVPKLAVPSGDGVIELGFGGALSSNSLILIPYGAGTAANTFTLGVYGWCRTLGSNQVNPLWVAYTLATFTCTLATPPGLATADVNASQLFCGTIVCVVGNTNVSNEVVSPTGNAVGHIMLDVKGSQFVQLLFGTGSSATSCNCLVGRR